MSPEHSHRIAPVWRKSPFFVGDPNEWERLLLGNEGKTLAQIVEGARRRVGRCGRNKSSEEEKNSKKETKTVTGMVVSWTRVPGKGVVALVEVKDGQGRKRKLTARLTDLEGDPEIGMRVEMVTRKLGEEGDEVGLILYGPKFRPAIECGEE